VPELIVHNEDKHGTPEDIKDNEDMPNNPSETKLSHRGSFYIEEESNNKSRLMKKATVLFDLNRDFNEYGSIKKKDSRHLMVPD
jgi:hypothetical protein